MLLAFGFGNLVMLGWLAAAAAPILIHLWSRRRYREVDWAAIEFLLAAMRKNSRRIQLQQWLLLAVRTLLVALVVLAVAEPFWESMPSAGGPGVPTHRVLVLDASFSMGLTTDDETLFAQAKQLAGQVVDASRVGDAFTVILMGEPARSVLGQPVVDQATVTGELARLELPHGGGDLASALALVEQSIEQADDAPLPLEQHEVYFFTDLGQPTWQAAATSGGGENSRGVGQRLDALAGRAAVVVVDVGEPGAGNLAVTRFALAAPFATLDDDVSLSGTVSNFSDQPRDDVNVELVVDGVVAESRVVDVAGYGEASVAVGHRFDSPGTKVVSLRLSGDRLAIDNTRWLTVPVKDELRVLCVAGKLGAADYLARALDPQADDAAERSAIRPLVVSDGELLDLDLTRFDCVFLSNVARLTVDEAALLSRYVRQGGGLVVFLGDRVIADEYNRVLAGDPAIGDDGEPLLPARLGELVGDSTYRVDPLDYRHPIVAPFRGRERAGLLTTPVDRYFRLELPADRPAAEVALGLAGGDSLVVAAPIGQGRVVLVATAGSLASVDAATGQPWTTMPAWPSFLPIVREMLLYALGGGAGDGELLVGATLGGAVDPGAGVNGVELTRPDGRVDTASVVDGLDGPAWSYDGTNSSGVYVARAVGASDGNVEKGEQFAVNVDPAESDLTRIDAGDLPADIVVRNDWRGSAGGGVDRGLARRGQMERWMLYGALALALVEVFLAWSFGRGNA
jgi:hypothetical protein